MGQGQSIRQKVDEKKNLGQYKEAFKLLETEKMMRDKLDCKRANLYIKALNDECIPIVCAVDAIQDCLVVDREALLESEIERCLEKHLSGDYHGKLSELVTVVLKSVMTTQKTEHEEQHTHVVLANGSVIRIDYFLFFKKSDDINVLCYYLQVGVIDMTRARKQVLIYELTRATNKGKLKDAGKELNEIANSITALTGAVDTLSKAARGEITTEDANDDLNEEMEHP